MAKINITQDEKIKLKEIPDNINEDVEPEKLEIKELSIKIARMLPPMEKKIP
jgi:hypothetical protein